MLVSQNKMQYIYLFLQFPIFASISSTGSLHRLKEEWETAGSEILTSFSILPVIERSDVSSNARIVNSVEMPKSEAKKMKSKRTSCFRVAFYFASG
jgi:hypothetical protein